MFPGGAPLGITPHAADDAPYASIVSLFYSLYNRGTLDNIVLLFKATVYDPVLVSTVEVKAIWTNQSQQWRGKSDDFDYYPNTLLQPSSFRITLFDNLFTSSSIRGSSSSFGDIRMIMSEEAGTDWTRYYWGGRPWELLIGQVGFGFSEFIEIGSGKVKSIQYDEKGITLKISEPDAELKKDIQTDFYTGLGGLNGTPELKDQKKPLCFGTVFNGTPKLIDPVFDVYQIHDGEIESVTPFDGGVLFNQVGPTLDTTDVYGWTPVAGEYITDLSKGLFRLGNHPGLELTFDAEGDADSGDYVQALTDVVKRIILQRTAMTEAQLVGLVPLASFQNAPVGLYLENGGSTVEDAINELINPLLVYKFFDLSGNLTFGQFKISGVSHALEESDIISMRRIGEVGKISSMRLRYRKVYTVQSDVALALNDPDFLPNRKVQVSTPYTELETVGVSTNHLLAETIILDTPLQTEVEAQAESDRQIELSDSLKGEFELVTSKGLFNYLPGQTIRATYPKIGVSSDKFVILGKTSNIANGKVTLNLVG